MKNQVWNTVSEYIDNVLQEISKEEIMNKVIAHNNCSFAYIKRMLSLDLYSKEEILEYVNSILSENKDIQELLQSKINSKGESK